MPLYEYQCKECGEEFEKVLRFSEANQTPICPACQSQLTRKKLSTIAARVNALGGAITSTNNNCGSRGGFS
jgi:putative FmdB family regulatory protein